MKFERHSLKADLMIRLCFWVRNRWANFMLSAFRMHTCESFGICKSLFICNENRGIYASMVAVRSRAHHSHANIILIIWSFVRLCGVQFVMHLPWPRPVRVILCWRLCTVEQHWTAPANRAKQDSVVFSLFGRCCCCCHVRACMRANESWSTGYLCTL